MRTLCWMCRLCFFFLSLPVLSLNHFSFMGFFLATGFRAVLALSFSSYSFSLFSQLPAKQGCIGVRCSASSRHRDCIVRKHLLSETRELSILSCRLCDGSVTMNVFDVQRVALRYFPRKQSWCFSLFFKTGIFF